MSDSMSFSMASMYGDMLLSSDSNETTNNIKTDTDKIVQKTELSKEEELPPLKVETIYNMAFLQRPQTSIVTHGEDNRDDSMRIDEEDDESFNKDGNATADIWIAEDEKDDEAQNIDTYQVDNEGLGSSNIGKGYEQKSLMKRETQKKKPSGIIDCMANDLVWCVYASSMAHHATAHTKTKVPWISSGLFPQVFIVRFDREIRLDTITIEASGVLELVVLINKPGDHQPRLQFRDGSRESRTLELERSEVIGNEVCFRADNGVGHFLVIYDVGVTGQPVDWDSHW
mmetsp:Transcript_30231/g.35682  ORF Transcript_30231/g.35682 Transcript_30231/m.35682 type:complete len:285 (-) Transcript_30231:172-1026(-)